MAPSLSHTIGAVLAALEAHVPRARDQADFGDHKPLSTLIKDVIRDENARVLLDPGAQAELLSEDPALGTKWQFWLDADLASEASWRAGVHHTSVTFGPKSVGLTDLASEIRSSDAARRDEAWLVSERAWRLPLSRMDWAQRVAVKDPDPAPSSSFATTPGGLVIPDATMIALFSQPEIVVALDEIPGAEVEEMTADNNALSDADLFRVAEMAQELARSVGIRARDFAGWSFAIAGSTADFSLSSTPRPSRPTLPGPRFGTPISRDSAAWFRRDHSARGLLISELAHDRSAQAAGLVATGNLRQLLASPIRDRDYLVRLVALSWCGLLLEAEWAHRAAGDLKKLQAGCKTLVPGGAPDWWLELASLESSLSDRPGEKAAIYAHSHSMAQRLLQGVALHLFLRDRFDEDWMLNPSAEPSSATACSDVSGDQLLSWLRESCRL